MTGRVPAGPLAGNTDRILDNHCTHGGAPFAGALRRGGT